MMLHKRETERRCNQSCPDRTATCHATCKRYAADRAEDDAARAKRYQWIEATDYFKEQRQKNKAIKRKSKMKGR